jgi:hypothetical protein
MPDGPENNLKHEPPVDLVAPPQTHVAQILLGVGFRPIKVWTTLPFAAHDEEECR